MANKKITDIDTITSINDTDKIVVTETDTSVKRISYANLMKDVNDKIDNNTSQLNDLEYESVSRIITVGNGQMFKTIQEAINSIKKYVLYDTKIKIECDPGTYNEEIKLGGYYGGGTIEINTNKSAISLQSIILEKCNIEITLNNLTLTSTTNHSIAIADCNDSIISYCGIGGNTPSNSGIFVMNSNVIIKNTSISGKYCGIVAYENSNIYSNSNTGSGNYIGLNVGSNSVIGKNGTQPSGTTMETISGGGIIR